MQPETHQSLSPRIQRALAAIEAGRVLYAEEAHVECDISELNLEDREAYLDLIHDCLQISARRPVEYFRQPAGSYSTKHALSKGLRMWAFEVPHPDYLPKLIYFKFCLLDATDGSTYIHIDCHESRPKH